MGWRGFLSHVCVGCRCERMSKWTLRRKEGCWEMLWRKHREGDGEGKGERGGGEVIGERRAGGGRKSDRRLVIG